MKRLTIALFFLTSSLFGCANTLEVKESNTAQNIGIDKVEVAGTLRKAAPYFQACYDKEEEPLGHVVVLDFDIAQSGQVSGVRIPKSNVSKSLEQCVKRELLSLRFPKHKESKVTMTERIKFKR